MLAELKPYSEYKEIDQPWLGSVPAHWTVSRLKWHLSRNDAGVWGTEVGEGGTIVLRSTEQTVDGQWRIAKPARVRLAPEQIDSAMLRAGDLVVTKSSGSPAHIGKTSIVSDNVARLKCCFSNFMQRLRVKTGTAHPEFAWRLLNSHLGRQQFVFSTTTTTGLGNLNGTILANCCFAFPPPAEQAGIVRFLGAVDRKVNRFIRAKRRLIEVLTEQKQAIITHAVTKGLNPHAPLKPSGIDWLGDVPEHWEVRRLASFARSIGNGYVGPTRSILRDHGVRYLQSLHIKDNQIRFDTPYYVEESWMQGQEKCRLRTGDLVIVQTGDIGQVACVPSDFDGCGCHALIIVRLHKGVADPHYVATLLDSGFGFESLKRIETGALHPHLNCRHVRGLFLPVPPIEEQVAITAHAADASAGRSRAIDHARREIDLIREYRTRLVADVVTGKLDVRGVAALYEALAGDELVNDGAVEAEVPEDGDPEDVEEVVNVDEETDHLQKA